MTVIYRVTCYTQGRYIQVWLLVSKPNTQIFSSAREHIKSERISDDSLKSVTINNMFFTYMVQIACAFSFFQEVREFVSTTWFGTTSQAGKTGILPTNWAYSDLSSSHHYFHVKSNRKWLWISSGYPKRSSHSRVRRSITWQPLKRLRRRLYFNERCLRIARVIITD